ncbi:MAG: hypothetical protein K1X53_16860, partial [Candidatus Sumerlaeaceae bacterium]|nr:hypothetical protein [Candidatus Sumerlaeaceae bacterium]
MAVRAYPSRPVPSGTIGSVGLGHEPGDLQFLQQCLLVPPTAGVGHRSSPLGFACSSFTPPLF